MWLNAYLSQEHPQRSRPQGGFFDGSNRRLSPSGFHPSGPQRHSDNRSQQGQAPSVGLTSRFESGPVHGWEPGPVTRASVLSTYIRPLDWCLGTPGRVSTTNGNGPGMRPQMRSFLMRERSRFHMASGCAAPPAYPRTTPTGTHTSRSDSAKAWKGGTRCSTRRYPTGSSERCSDTVSLDVAAPAGSRRPTAPSSSSTTAPRALSASSDAVCVVPPGSAHHRKDLPMNKRKDNRRRTVDEQMYLMRTYLVVR